MTDTEQIIPMNSTEFKGLMEIEEYWHRHGSFPKQIFTPGFVLTEAMKKESFIRGLFNRGITPPSNDANLSDSQLAAILLVVDINDRRTINSKLKSLGVKPTTWQGWMRDKGFKDFLHNLSSRNFEDALHVAQQGLLGSVEKGDVNAIKYWNELTGRATPVEVQNIKVLISRLIQVIQTHVKDEATLAAIARDLQRVMAGQEPAQPGMLERIL